MKRETIKIDENTWKRVKLIALREDKKIYEVIGEAIEEWLRRKEEREE